MIKTDRRVFEDFKLPSNAPPTPNELAWIEFLRCIDPNDPEPTLAAVQALRTALRPEWKVR
jgi:hypothetical protein